MQTEITQAQVQPLFKLAQNNATLLTDFWTSPEVVSEFSASAAQWLQQVHQTSTKLMMTGAFSTLSQGLLRNALGFMSDCRESAALLMKQKQLALLDEAQEEGAAVEVPEVRLARRRAA